MWVSKVDAKCDGSVTECDGNMYLHKSASVCQILIKQTLASFFAVSSLVSFYNYVMLLS